jgi:glycerate kinase
VLVAPAPFKGTLGAPAVAAALSRGLEAGGWQVDPCPLADGGVGTLDVLLPGLGGETSAVEVGGRPVGIGLIEDGGTAIVELASVLGPRAHTSAPAAELVRAAAATGADVVLVGAGDVVPADRGVAAAAALTGERLRARVVVLCDVRNDPGRAGGGIAGKLATACGAQLVGGASFVLDALDADERMRRARAVVVGEGRLDLATIGGHAAGELATRARQSGVPCFAVVGERALDPFGERILDLQAVLEAGNLEALEAAGRQLASLV